MLSGASGWPALQKTMLCGKLMMIMMRANLCMWSQLNAASCLLEGSSIPSCHPSLARRATDRVSLSTLFHSPLEGSFPPAFLGIPPEALAGGPRLDCSNAGLRVGAGCRMQA